MTKITIGSFLIVRKNQAVCITIACQISSILGQINIELTGLALLRVFRQRLIEVGDLGRLSSY